MTAPLDDGRADEPGTALAPFPKAAVPSFEQLYEEQVGFVWRNLRRLGVGEASLRDVAQDVFLVVHRRLPEFEGRAPLRSWLYSIVRRVVQQHRRGMRRKALDAVADPDEVADARAPSPERRAAHQQDLALLLELLGRLDDEKREAFVLADLEQMSVPEIAEALEINLNTVYSRVRAARRELQAELEAHTRREGGSR